MLNLKHILLFLLLLFSLNACASHQKPDLSTQTPQSEQIQDIKDFPQNLNVYADLAGKNKLLLSAQEQERLYETFKKIYFGPWRMTKTSIGIRSIAPNFTKASGYKDASRYWTQAEWDAMKANAGLKSYPARNQRGITLRKTDLRELPTHESRFTEPTSDISQNPFDYFQYHPFPAGMPLFIAHTTMDGRWHYVESPIAGGWVDAKDIAFVDDNFIRNWERGDYAAIIQDNVALPGIGSSANIGAIFPLVSKNGGSEFSVLLPSMGNNGYAVTREARLSGNDAVVMPMALTPANAARIGNVMMNQPYGWGGVAGLRDCSSMIKDFFTPFGIWLPRNSVAQAKRGAIIPLSGLSAADKNRIIINNGVPFLSLVGMPGHITLYVGAYKGRAALFHNIWGVRIIKDGNDNERFVIGRTVVTSITPGIELKNLYRSKTFVDRVKSLTKIGR